MSGPSVTPRRDRVALAAEDCMRWFLRTREPLPRREWIQPSLLNSRSTRCTVSRETPNSLARSRWEGRKEPCG